MDEREALMEQGLEEKIEYSKNIIKQAKNGENELTITLKRNPLF